MTDATTGIQQQNDNITWLLLSTSTAISYVCVCVFTLTRVSNPPSYGMQPPFLHRVHHNHFLSLLPSLCLDPEHSTDTNNILTCTRTYVHHCESTTTKPQHLQAHHCHILTYFQTSTKLTDAATQVLCVFSSSWPPS